MSFVTNNNSRRTKRARVQNSIPDRNEVRAQGTSGTSFAVTTARHLKGARDTTITETTIGSHSSKGLVINGGMAGKDFNHPYNPDQLDVPLAINGQQADGDPAFELGHPAYPISFSGPGYLKFVGPTALPSILGPVHITGDVTVSGALTHTGSSPVGGSSSTELEEVIFNPSIQDSVGNGLTGGSASGSYYTLDAIHYFQAIISWTGKGSINNSSPMRLYGMPFTTYTVGSAVDVHIKQGVVALNVGGGIHARYTTTGNTWLDLVEYSTTSGADAQNVVGAEFESVGQLVVTGWLTV